LDDYFSCDILLAQLVQLFQTFYTFSTPLFSSTIATPFDL